MNWQDIRFLYLHELRCALRERNVMLYVILVPSLLYPFLVWLTITSISFVMGQSEKSPVRITVVGVPPAYADLIPELKRQLKSSQVNLSTTALETVPVGTDLVLNFKTPSLCQVLYDSAQFRSGAAKDHVETFLRHYRDKKLEDEGKARGLKVADLQEFGLEIENIATAQDVGAYLLGVLLPFTLIVILTLGGMYSAIDCTAGERERATWETSLTLATARTNLVIAKYMYVSTMSSVAGLLNLVAMTISLRSFIAPISVDMANQISMSLPLRALPVILLGTLTLSALLSALMMLFSSLARTFREGQALVSPLFLLMLLPTALVMDKTLQFDKSTALIPVVNVALLWRESLQGQFSWELFTITLVVCIMGVGFCLMLAQIFMAQESLLLDGGARLWRRLLPPFLRSRMNQNQ